MTLQNEKKIGDIMVSVRGCATVSSDCSLQDVVRLIKYNFSKGRNTGFWDNGFILVCDECGDQLGFVTFRSILRSLEPFFARAGVFLSWQGLFTDRCREEARTRVKEIMKPLNAIAVNPGDTLSKAVHNMFVHRLGCLPVVENNRLVGIVRPQELFREIYQVMRKSGYEMPEEKGSKKLRVLPAQHPFPR